MFSSFYPDFKYGMEVRAFHLVEIFSINEWKLKRSILNWLKYKKIKCAITLYLFDLDGDFDSKEDLLYLAAIRQTFVFTTEDFSTSLNLLYFWKSHYRTVKKRYKTKMETEFTQLLSCWKRFSYQRIYQFL